ncbi:MAG: hypothetical protein J3Q66DRAFT_363001 [Benniella sp.]|nr:MAG: hypothetical protein J3Q66DRAFT_363001 [Benniella sp.]
MIFSTLSKASLVVILASSLLVLTKEAESHSWAACMDWRFKDSKTKGVKGDWADKNGRCEGYARNFPVGEKGDENFYGLDSNSPHRHFEQKNKNPEEQPACSNGKNGKRDDTFDESLKIPYEKAYEGKSRKGFKFGPMSVKKAGERICIRWPAKNHAVGSENKESPVYIAISGLNPKKDPSQREFSSQPNGKKKMKQGEVLEYKGKTQRIAALDYDNCDKGPSDERRCGGCFNLPKNLEVGYYAVQWRWELNENEWYTSCADIKITGGSGSSTSPTPIPSPTTTPKKSKKH